ncbi:MAG: aminodeoxychorismate lyase [Arenimonas sp.]|jgi:4-amino-4-deoxychorismate lyase
MTAKVLRNGRVRLWLEPEDRGLAYGDGVFETLLVHRGQPVWWSEHWHRLLRGAKVLGLPVPDQAQVRDECESLLEDSPRAVLKVILTRGNGGRGYGAPEDPTPTVILSSHPAPPPLQEAIALRWCQTALAIQPALAGIKHLNRLEQVLARAEWNDPQIAEGILCDTEDRVISATSANVFAYIGGRWLTPGVERCGIAGIARAWILANVPGAVEADLNQAEISRADALFLCNSVRGILPVRRLGLREWPEHPAIVKLCRQLAASQPAFAIQEQ